MLSFHATPILAASGALQFAINKATPEGKITMSALLLLSLFSWTIIISKARQLIIARKWAKRFFAAYNATRDPLDIKRGGESFEGAPAYQLYVRGADELDTTLRITRWWSNHAKALKTTQLWTPEIQTILHGQKRIR